MFKINRDILFRIIIFTGFSGLFIFITITGEVRNIVHVRVVPFLILAVILMVLSIIFLCANIFKPMRKRVNLITIAIYILPLIISTNYFINEYNTKNKVRTEIQDLENYIYIGADEFKEFIDSVHSTSENKYINGEVKVVGFIYKEEGKTYLGRNVMTCCAADMHIIGIECEGMNIDKIENEQWVEALGKVSKEGKLIIKKVILNDNIDKSPIHQH